MDRPDFAIVLRRADEQIDRVTRGREQLGALSIVTDRGTGERLAARGFDVRLEEVGRTIS